MNKETVTSWLDKLQQESWNLELLISGFSIFLLLQVGDFLTRYSNRFYELMSFSFEAGMVALFLSILKVASYVMVVNLLVHVVTRGVWVGMVGLRSVGDIDEIEQLNYSQRFSNYLSKRLVDLDELIIRLDKVSSVIFAFTFLLVFMLLSLFVWLGIFAVFARIAQQIGRGGSDTLMYGTISFFVLYLLFSLVYLLDTVSIGFFKKNRLLSRLYFPVYRFFTLITLSFIYRSIYYHLIARLPRRVLQIILALYIFVIGFAPFHTLNYDQFFPDNTNRFTLNNLNYNDRLPSKGRIQSATIPSPIIRDKVFPLFIRYQPANNTDIAALCKDYTPSKEQAFISGVRFNLEGEVYVGSPTITEESPEKLLNCLSQFYQVYIDTVPLNDQRYYFDQHPNNGEKGITTAVRLDSISPGSHYLSINTRHLVADTIQERNYARIIFWKE